MVERKGRTELVYLSEDLFEIVEKVRKEIGLSSSGFFRYCIVKVLNDMNVLSTKAKNGLFKEVEVKGVGG